METTTPTDPKTILDAFNLVDRAASMATLNRVDHENILRATQIVRNYLQSQISEQKQTG